MMSIVALCRNLINKSLASLSELKIAVALKEYDIQCPGLPLAVYREIAAHLRQIDQVETDLLPQEAKHFDYALSQIGWLRIRHPQNLPPTDQEQLQQILDFYSQRFGKWVPRSNSDSISNSAAS